LKPGQFHGFNIQYLRVQDKFIFNIEIKFYRQGTN
jgi:hypothetical protein